jgi:methyl-accepting chemotaxis protein
MRDLEGAVGRMASGDYDIPVVGLGRADELGSIARAIDGFRDQLAQGMQLKIEQERLERLADEERARNEASRGVPAREQAFVVGSVAQGLSTWRVAI